MKYCAGPDINLTDSECHQGDYAYDLAMRLTDHDVGLTDHDVGLHSNMVELELEVKTNSGLY